jgi:hypothetical protein
MSRIFWTLEDEQDRLEDEQDKLEDYSGNTLVLLDGFQDNL